MDNEFAPATGRHFLQIPGPTPIPDRIQRAMDMPIIDHRGPAFRDLARRVLDGVRPIFGTAEPVIIYPSSGTGAWEAALVNTLSPGDRVLMVETGHFASLWQKMARRLGLEPVLLATDWRRGANPDAIEQALRNDAARDIKAVCVVHNETSTGCVSPIAAVRAAIDAARHPALLLVDTISSLGSMEYRHDDWGVDVTVGGSQKGLMLPPGLAFNAISQKARDAATRSAFPKAYWSWEDMLASNANGFFPYTPATTLLYGLATAVDMLAEEGLERVFLRHARLAEGVRAAVRHWELESLCADPASYSASLTAVLMPSGHSADAVRAYALERFNLSLGAGLGKLADKIFRIGHLGHTNELTILGALGGIEMALKLASVPFRSGGVTQAIGFFAQ